MNRTWFSYVVLAVGLMLLVASDKQATADDKKTAHTVSFGSDQKIEVFVNKDGETDAEVKIVIDGEKLEFSLPDLADGEDKTFTTEDGKEITIKSISGNKIIWIDGKEMNLPSLGKHHMNAEGLSAMIARTHVMEISDDITINGHGLSDDVKAAVVEAVKGVLTSYDIKKKVSFSNNKMGLHFMGEDGNMDGMNKFHIEVESDDSGENEHVMIIRKEIKVEEKDDN